MSLVRLQRSNVVREDGCSRIITEPRECIEELIDRLLLELRRQAKRNVDVGDKEVTLA